MTKTVVLCILDGWGHRQGGSDNAIAHAHTPHWDKMLVSCPHTLLEASEHNVGLPGGQMGNSEVGHMNIGAGRVMLQDLPRIDQAIEEGTLETLPALQDFIASLQASQGTCHLMGLLSSGGVHSHERHIKALSKTLSNAGIPVAIHAFLDGRDTPPKSAEGFIEGMELATIGGRYYAMDRDNRWDRIELAYKAMVEAPARVDSASDYIKQMYEAGISDEFIIPMALGGYPGMRHGDGVLMANFRSDRARAILKALLDPAFDIFERKKLPVFAAALGMTEYATEFSSWMQTLFSPYRVTDSLGDVIAQHGLKQMRIAETEKYAHVTFFFNGGQEALFEGEDRILIPSPDVATYDLQPEMAAAEVTDAVEAAIASQQYALIVVNYANTDMVGHTGNFEATRKAVEAVDACLGRLQVAVEETGACLLITADHGNAEEMHNGDLDAPHTAHTLNPVPFVMVNGPAATLYPGSLADIAPTVLDILEIPCPAAMTGHSLREAVHA